jgi:hypothetical protein
MILCRLLVEPRAIRALSAAMCGSLPGGLVALVITLATQTCNAAVLTLVSSPSNLNSLTPGQPVTIQIALSGLNSGDRLDFLAATIAFSGNLLGTPNVTPGPIIPDLTGFTPGESNGVADGIYDSLFAISGMPITTNGIFYSFGVTVMGAGSGTIAFDFVDSSGTNSSGAPLPIATAGSPLTFASAGGSVPEPPSWLLGGLGLLGIIAFREARLKLLG